jgi:hypothetical protein
LPRPFIYPAFAAQTILTGTVNEGHPNSFCANYIG